MCRSKAAFEGKRGHEQATRMVVVLMLMERAIRWVSSQGRCILSRGSDHDSDYRNSFGAGLA